MIFIDYLLIVSCGAVCCCIYYIVSKIQLFLSCMNCLLVQVCPCCCKKRASTYNTVRSQMERKYEDYEIEDEV